MAIALLGNAIPTGAILVVLITILAPISEAHLNPAVTIAFLRRGEIQPRLALAYVGVQVAGAVCRPLLRISCLSFHLFRSRQNCEMEWHNGYRSLWQPLVC